MTADIIGKQFEKGTESPSSNIQSPNFFGTPMVYVYITFDILIRSMKVIIPGTRIGPTS